MNTTFVDLNFSIQYMLGYICNVSAQNMLHIALFFIFCKLLEDKEAASVFCLHKVFLGGEEEG